MSVSRERERMDGRTENTNQSQHEIVCNSNTEYEQDRMIQRCNTNSNDDQKIDGKCEEEEQGRTERCWRSHEQDQTKQRCNTNSDDDDQKISENETEHDRLIWFHLEDYLHGFPFSDKGSHDSSTCWIFAFCMALAEKLLLMEYENDKKNPLAYLYMRYGTIAVEKLQKMDIFHFLPWIYYSLFSQKLTIDWLHNGDYMGWFIIEMCMRGDWWVDVEWFFLNELYEHIPNPKFHIPNVCLSREREDGWKNRKY